MTGVLAENGEHIQTGGHQRDPFGERPDGDRGRDRNDAVTSHGAPRVVAAPHSRRGHGAGLPRAVGGTSPTGTLTSDLGLPETVRE